MRRLLAVILLLGGVAFAGVDSTPKLYYSDVASVPAGSYVCIAGRNFPAQGSATVTLIGTDDVCNFCDSGCDDTLTTYTKDTWDVGTADDHACVEMPTAAGHCAGTVTGIKIDDGVDDSNTVNLARHSGTVYCVAEGSGTASDSNNCSDCTTNACLTLRGGADKLSAGDVLLVRTGTYDTPDGTDKPILWFSSSRNDPNGTSSSPVTIRGYPGEFPVVKNGINEDCRNCFSVTRDWVQVAGLETTSGLGNAISGDNNRWSGNKLSNANDESCFPINEPSGNGIHMSGNNTKVFGNDMLNNDPDDNNFNHGVYVTSSNNEIAFNEFSGNARGAMLFKSSSPNINDNLVHSNHTHDNNSHGILLGGGDRNKAYNNISHDNGGAGIKVQRGDPADSEIFNNTIYNNTQDCVILGGTGVTVGTIVKNNICHSNAGGDTITENSGTSGTVASNNFGVDSGGDPLFVVDGSDFHLQDASGAIDYGTSPPSSRSIDYELNAAPFGSSHDAGAYEWLDDVSTPPECGNNIREGAEVCDGDDLNGQACTDQGGFDCGTLSCAAGCAAFDTDECVATTACGNNVTDTIGDCTEFCDGTDLNGESCADNGFECGALACNVGCTAFVTTGCEANCLESVIGTVTLEGVTID